MPADTSALRKLAADLGAAPARVRRDIEGALERAADDLVARARALAPVETGELRDSIRASGSGMEVTVSATAPHAIYVEHGTRKMGPRPFMGPATDAVEPKLVADLGKVEIL